MVKAATTSAALKTESGIDAVLGTGPGSRGNQVDKTLRGGGQPGRDLTIGELAARTASTVSALHFYERQGLLAPHRTGGNQRRYPAGAVAVVGFIRSARQAGIPLSLIREVLHCRRPAAQPAQRACARLCAEVSARELALRQVRSHLSSPACQRTGASQPNPPPAPLAGAPTESRR